ncbi:MAG: class I SAM-dependent methyltransferase [Anaerolineae bacterium]
MEVLNGVASRYDLGMWPLEGLVLRDLRHSLLSHLSGRVLELGVGTGTNVPHYASQANVVAVDLSAGMLPIARQRPGGSRMVFVQADAIALPVLSQSMDYVTGSLIFCSMEEPERVLDEAQRVLRPGGWLVLLEHVRGLDPFTRTLTDLLAPAWHRVTRSCHLDRETAAMVARSGLRVIATSSHFFGLVQVILARKD